MAYADCLLGNNAITNQLAPFSSPDSNQESDMIQPTAIGSTPSRSNLVQVFRALAIIAVVMIHTSPPDYGQVFIRPFINFAVATFLFLSGYLTKIENDDWPHFYKKRILRVLIPYVVWTVLYTLASRDLAKLPTNLLLAKAIVPMYYIFVYIQFVLLTPLLGKLALSRYQFLGWFVAPIAVLVFKYYWLLTGQDLNPYVNIIWDKSCLGWFTFYYLGLLLGNRIITKHYSLKVLILFYSVSIVLQMAEGYGWLMLGETNCGSQVKLSSFLTSSLFLLIVYTILQRGQYDVKSKFLLMLGDYSFGIYLCHIMVMKVLAFVPAYSSLPFPITSAIVLLLSLAFCYIGEKVCGGKISRWLGLR